MRVAVAVLACALAMSVAPAAAEPLPAYPHPSGCPSVSTEGGYTSEPDVPALAPANQHIVGVGMAADATDLTATIQVENMSAVSAPGYRWAYWQVHFDSRTGSRTLSAFYDTYADEFTFWSFLGDATPRVLSGDTKMGPEGGLSISVPLELLSLQPGDVLTAIHAEAGNFISYVYMDAPNHLTGTYPSGIYSTQWGKYGHFSFPLIPCPGVALEVKDRGYDPGAIVRGHALPQDSHDVTVERLSGGSWSRLADAESTRSGAFTLLLPNLPAGTHTLRAVVHTSTMGDVISAPTTVTVD